MGWGGFGGWPFEWGGGPSDEETIYQTLRNAVGVGGSAKSDDGIDGLWRECRAAGLAAASSSVERAVLQAFANLATDHIPLIEEELGITPPDGATEEDRRIVVSEAVKEKAFENEVDLAVRLAKIDARFSLVSIPPEKTAYVQLGKDFEPLDGSPTYGVWKSTPAPNYSTDFYVPVLLTTGGGPMPTPVDIASITKAKRLLHADLPAWVDFAVVTSLGPLLADVSPLDLTCTT